MMHVCVCMYVCVGVSVSGRIACVCVHVCVCAHTALKCGWWKQSVRSRGKKKYRKIVVE